MGQGSLSSSSSSSSSSSLPSSPLPASYVLTPGKQMKDTRTRFCTSGNEISIRLEANLSLLLLLLLHFGQGEHEQEQECDKNNTIQEKLYFTHTSSEDLDRKRATKENSPQFRALFYPRVNQLLTITNQQLNQNREAKDKESDIEI